MFSSVQKSLLDLLLASALSLLGEEEDPHLLLQSLLSCLCFLLEREQDLDDLVTEMEEGELRVADKLASSSE